MKIVDIEGIGDVSAEKLITIGIKTVEDLLDRAGTPKGRDEIAEATGISSVRLMTWVNHADLIRVLGIGPQMAELLEAAGVDTVPELARRSAENLHTKMAEVNEQKHLTKRMASVSQIANWIEQCKSMDRKITY